jgi:hypothetical protein
MKIHTFRRDQARLDRSLGTAGNPNSLMSRYWARPMDFADATLVYLARREGLSIVFTVDHTDFDTDRMKLVDGSGYCR